MGSAPEPKAAAPETTRESGKLNEKGDVDTAGRQDEHSRVSSSDYSELEKPTASDGRTSFSCSAIPRAFTAVFSSLGNLFGGQSRKSKKTLKEEAIPAAALDPNLRLKQSLGTRFREPFRGLQHLQQDKCWSGTQERWMATNQLRWYVPKGTSVSNQKPVQHKWYLEMQSEEHLEKKVRVTIYQCEDDVLPSRLDETVKALCYFDFKPDIPFDDLEEWVAPNGNRLKYFHYDLKMIPSGASIEFVVLSKGRVLGSKKATIKLG